MINQRTIYDCGICALAMALDTSYKDITTQWPNEVDGIGVTAQETVKFLVLNEYKRYKPVLLQTREALAELDPQAAQRNLFTTSDVKQMCTGLRAILTIKTSYGELHAVYWNGKQIHDPARKSPHNWDQYEVLEAVLLME
ncbi:hypothetical protein CJF42_03520 [Pseudoalteromonas sp. NBT06-2]|uniref:hypothetical protein n=1 Tax=Pseudoalteromonas sp. NBT06-2 TaxID=2025950 RepID=UPI000BA5632E|nr:hypothetical protein [Pseudoalteromonas sp. NBT06-2]PAJ75712.1 hypothetical protein CJF42_03520 [Pseudoalteromonas sp. NBT06-2]